MFVQISSHLGSMNSDIIALEIVKLCRTWKDFNIQGIGNSNIKSLETQLK
jgi:hypothetical protein